jgi:hypothetical protein
MFLWISRRWPRTVVRLVAALALCVVAGLLVFNGQPSARLAAALALFTPGQLAWLLVDAFRLVRQRRNAGENGPS